MARTIASQSMIAFALPLILAALLPGTSRAARVSEHDFLNEEDYRAPAHLRLLAARGSDLQAFIAAVNANEERASALLDTTSELEQPDTWPAAWRGKVGKAREVGRGAFGKVFVAPLKCNGDMVAVKKLSTQNAQMVSDEINVMKAALGDANVIQYFTADKSPTTPTTAYYIMMEAAGGGNLGDYLNSKEDTTLFLGMLRGMKELHSRGFVHRDLKPANVMVSSKCGGETPCYAKIGDLGLGCSTASSVKGVPKCKKGEIAGTPLFIAPETYSRGIVHPANDVWAMGLMLYEMTFGRLPSKIARSASIKDLEKNIKSMDIADDKGYNSLPPESALKELIAGMLNPSETSRMSMAEALQKAEAWGAGGFADRASGSVPKLPACFSQEPVHDTKDEEVEEAPAKGDIAFFVIKKPMMDSATIIFGKDLVGKSGKVSEAISTIKEQFLGSAKTLQPGDQILQVNSKPWKTVKEDDDLRELMKSGGDGPLVIKYRKA